MTDEQLRSERNRLLGDWVAEVEVTDLFPLVGCENWLDRFPDPSSIVRVLKGR